MDNDRERDLVAAAQGGSTVARDELLIALLPIAQRISRNYKRRYPWIEEEDLSQWLISDLCIRAIKRFGLEQQKTSFGKYVYHRMVFGAKDWLRALDPLGISWPQRKHYPAWHHLESTGDTESEHDFASQLVESIDGSIGRFEVVDLLTEVASRCRLPDPDLLVRHVLHGVSVEQLIAEGELPLWVHETVRIGLPALRELIGE